MSPKSIADGKIDLLLIGILFIIGIIAYAPYITRGGFGPSDDMMLVSSSIDHFSFSKFIASRLTSSSSARPVSVLTLAAALFLYRNNPTYYLVTQLIIWAGAIWALSFTIRHIFGKQEAWIFALIMVFPFFCSTILLSSYYVLSEYGLSIFFWALSLFFLTKHLISGKYRYYILSYASLLIGLLSLSIILPLLIITAIFPIVFQMDKKKIEDREGLIRSCLKYILPVLFAALFFLIFQVFITKYYQTAYNKIYGLAPISIKSFAQGAYYFVALLCEVPLMLFEAIPRLFTLQVLSVAIGICIFILILRHDLKDDSTAGLQGMPKKRSFMLVIVISLIACAFSFFLSNYPAVTYGSYNRMMLPSFILVCMIMSRVLSILVRKKNIIPVILLILLWASSMIIQLNNFVESWELRKEVFCDCIGQLEKADLSRDPVLIANVPYFTQKNYNNEEVFWLTWAFEGGLKIFGFDRQIMAIPVCWRIVADKDYNPAHNINNMYDAIEKDANIWYYEFDSKTHRSKLEKIATKDELRKKMEQVRSAKINYSPLILRERMKNALRYFLVATHARSKS